MEFKDMKDTRGLTNMDLCVVKLKNRYVWDKTGFVIAVYLNGRFYDNMLFEQGEVHIDDNLCEHSIGYAYLGEKYTKDDWN